MVLTLVIAAVVAGLVPGLAAERASVPAREPAAAPATPTACAEATEAPVADAAEGEPVRLVIPAIGVDARVEPIATESESLEPPADVTHVGWWAAGARPGSARGAVLLSGHTVHSGGGVFDDLGDVAPGDTVRVRTDAGWVTYRVTDVDEYSHRRLASASETLFDQTAASRLVLVTCSGYRLGRYHANTVVVANPVPSRAAAVD
ncbi:class F sortase [Aeromicrobium sp. 179-A 4D2 NHS]|uniref:class F sortase n=1 Tax=Aeromicrobium sp. 179-A 4D2 NHS TaxID=3142375 RepID=UPI0039A18416